MEAFSALIQDGPDLLFLQGSASHLQGLGQRHVHGACGWTKHIGVILIHYLITKHLVYVAPPIPLNYHADANNASKDAHDVTKTSIRVTSGLIAGVESVTLLAEKLFVITSQPLRCCHSRRDKES